jgi:uncharacterized protein
VLQTLDATAIRRWAAAGVDAFSRHEDELNKINVFPVADADTGTNLRLTMQSAFEALVRQPTGATTAATAAEAATAAATAAAALARGALLGARGNSGLVLSQVLRGIAESCDGVNGLSAARLRVALRRGSELATAAFAEPVRGTALSVLDAAADGAQACDLDVLSRVADAAVAAAADALAQTPSQLPALARAGVVDAGGRGVLVLLDALAGVIAEREPDGGAGLVVPRRPRSAESLRGTRESGSAEFDYEVMYLLDAATEQDVLALRAALAGIGDSVAVVGDGAGTWHVHVHCADVGAAIEAGLAAGRPRRITVIRFADQLAGVPAPRFARPRAVVAVVGGATGVQQLFRGEGATVVPDADVASLLAAITGTRAAHVVVLPNTADATAAADAAAVQARDAGQDVVVVPTASLVQGLAALAVHDPSRRPGDDVVAMAEAAAATRCGQLVIASEEALTWVGRCQPGDALGLVDGEVVVISPDLTAGACALVELMLSTGGEVVTALLGEHAPDGLTDALTSRLRVSRPEVELTVYDAGQAGPPLLVGVE